MKDNFDHYAWNQKRHMDTLADGLNDRIGSVTIVYTEQGGRLYSVKIDDSNGKRIDKVYQEEGNAILGYLGVEGEIPDRLEGPESHKLLDSIVQQLKDMGIDASWGDYMDIS